VIVVKNSESALSGPLRRSLHAYGPTESVIISPNGRQLGWQLQRKGKEVESLPLVDAIALRANHREIARLSSRGDVGYIERSDRVRALMDKARGTVGALPRPSGATGKGVTIAIMDTGIRPCQDFEGRIIAFHDVIGGKEEPYDDHGHGTMCAGCAAGSGAESGGLYQGVAPEADLVIVKTMDGDGGGSMLDVLRGMQWISDNRVRLGIRVLSLSLGIETEDVSDVLMRGVERLWTQGVVVVAAAGNSGPERGTINSPGRAPSVLTVGAVDDRGAQLTVPDFSSRGPVKGMQKPEICAPGVKLMTAKGEGYGLFTGTSAATPVAAGCAALLLEQHPDWRPDRIKVELMTHAKQTEGDFDEAGYGCIYIADDARW
jgi:serine protease AprX